MNAKKKFILALDCGSVNFRVAVFDSGLRRICERMEPLRYAVRVPERVEFDPEVAWRMAVRLMREACSQAGMSPEAACKVAITGQANTFCALDAAGQPLTPFFSWQDQRAAREAALLSRRLAAVFHQHCSWPRALPGHQASMLLWLRLHRPQILPKIVSIVTLPGYMALRLGAENSADPNLAALGDLYSLKTGRWWPVMMKLCGVSERQLPKLVPLGKPLAMIAPSRNLIYAGQAGVALAGNDQSASAFGNCCSPKTVLVTFGAGLAVYRVLGRRRPGPFSAAGCWGPYPGGGYYEVLTSKYGYAALDWARARLVVGRDIAFFTELARKAKLGRKGPGTNETEARFYPEAINTEQVWAGSSELGDQALAVFEGVGFALKRFIQDEIRISGSLSEIRIMGSGSSNAFWLQILADILGVRVGRAAGDALDGAARIASAPTAAAAARDVSPLVWFEPHEAAAYAARYERWRRQHPCAAPPPGRGRKSAKT